MSLEAQSVSSNVTQQQLEGMTQRLLAGSRRELW
jgi:hypothetical protein